MGPSIATNLLFDAVQGAFYIALYFLVTSVPFYLIFWRWRSAELAHTRVPQPQGNFPARPLKEALLSLGNLMLLLIPATLADIVHEFSGYRLRYDHISDYGWPYFFASIIGILLIVDAEFYWVHYLFHRRQSATHLVHHQFVNVTPFCGWAFHIKEAFAYVVPYIFIVFILPYNLYAMAIVQFIAMTWNSFLHLGYNPLPDWRHQHWALKWAMTSSEHGLHHQTGQGNYGLYFRFWDRWMGTEVKVVQD